MTRLIEIHTSNEEYLGKLTPEFLSDKVSRDNHIKWTKEGVAKVELAIYEMKQKLNSKLLIQKRRAEKAQRLTS